MSSLPSNIYKNVNRRRGLKKQQRQSMVIDDPKQTFIQDIIIVFSVGRRKLEPCRHQICVGKVIAPWGIKFQNVSSLFPGAFSHSLFTSVSTPEATSGEDENFLT